MAKKKQARQKKTDLKRICLLCFGSAAVVSVFFMLGFAVDFIIFKFTYVPPPGRFSILDNLPSGAKTEEKTATTRSEAEDYSFFETLVKKSVPNAAPDIRREEALRTHRPVRSGEKPENSPKTETIKRTVYAIQLGSFKGFAAARTFRDQYIAKGYHAYIVSGAVRGKGTLYRVRIGRFRNREDAQMFSTAFEKKENMSVFITSK